MPFCRRKSPIRPPLPQYSAIDTGDTRLFRAICILFPISPKEADRNHDKASEDHIRHGHPGGLPMEAAKGM